MVRNLPRHLRAYANRSIECAVAFHTSPANPLLSDVWKANYENVPTVSQLIVVEEQMYKRFGAFVANPSLGWKMLSILAHSAIFCYAGFTFDAEAWQAFCLAIEENSMSLELFSVARGLDWTTALIRNSKHHAIPSLVQTLNDQASKQNLDITSPHSYVVMEEQQCLRRPRFETHDQIDIAANIYDPEIFQQARSLDIWPHSKPYPTRDPTLRTPGHDTCNHCNGTHHCDCNPSTAFSHPLIELKDYGSPKGVGVRALQPIRKGSILAEYVGEIRSRYYAGDPVFGMELSALSGEEEAVNISSKRFGNWTRFLNHSCDASTEFLAVVLGDRHRVVVKAVRDIEVFEEITVDYGEHYWGYGKYCECGVVECRYSEEKTNDTTVSGVGGWRESRGLA